MDTNVIKRVEQEFENGRSIGLFFTKDGLIWAQVFHPTQIIHHDHYMPYSEYDKSFLLDASSKEDYVLISSDGQVIDKRKDTSFEVEVKDIGYIFINNKKCGGILTHATSDSFITVTAKKENLEDAKKRLDSDFRHLSDHGSGIVTTSSDYSFDKNGKGFFKR